MVEELTAAHLAAADVVTNSGHLRPLDAARVSRMRPGAAVPLMYESWEFRPADVDLPACRQRGVRVAGTNEGHPKVGVYEYLGLLALRGLLQCRVPPVHSRVLLVCDNPFVPFLARSLLGCAASLEILTRLELPAPLAACRRQGPGGDYDAVIVADPGPAPVIGRAGAAKYTPQDIGRFDALVQILGDVDRAALPPVAFYPEKAPPKGHMGINLAELGHDAIVRLQSGGLKVAQLLSDPAADPRDVAQYCQFLPEAAWAR